MSNLIQKHSKPIIVPVLLNSSDDALLKAGRYLARKLHAPLKLVHAVRPLFSYVGSGDIVMTPYYGYETTHSEQEEQEALSKLQILADGLDDVAVSAHVFRDFPADAVLTLAHETGAGLIICGVRGEDSARNTFLSGLSTGFSIAAEAEIPVLLVPLDAPVSFAEPLRILVADNFEDDGKQALAAGFTLANELHAENLSHLHVREVSFSQIDKMVDSLRESMILGQIPSDPNLNRDLYLEQLKSQTREEMVKRCEAKANSLNATQYEAVVAFGKPAEEVHTEVRRSGAQIMVFGRHHMIRRKHLSLGRIPYQAMIEQGVSTLIVPDQGMNL